jgi:hypothetical protein
MMAKQKVAILLGHNIAVLLAPYLHTTPTLEPTLAAGSRSPIPASSSLR